MDQGTKESLAWILIPLGMGVTVILPFLIVSCIALYVMHKKERKILAILIVIEVLIFTGLLLFYMELFRITNLFHMMPE